MSRYGECGKRYPHIGDGGEYGLHTGVERSARGHNIIHNKDVLAAQSLWLDNAEEVIDTLPALTAL